MPVEVTGLEVSEFAELIEGDVVDGPNAFTNGFVKFEYFPMSAGMEGSEIGRDVFGIFFEFFFPVGENKFRGMECDSPGDDPVSVSLNCFCWLVGSKVEFEFSEALNGHAVGCSGVHSGEDSVEVDGFSGKDIVPFHVRKFGYPFEMVLDHFPHEFLTGSEEYVLCRFGCEPGK